MPPSANMVSGKISVCAIPAFVASFSATLPGTVDAIGVKASRPPGPVVGVDLRGDAALGDQQRAEDADQQQRALQEQCGLVERRRRPSTAVWPDRRAEPDPLRRRRRPVRRPDRRRPTSAAPGSARRAAGTPRPARRARRRRSTINIGESRPYSTEGGVIVTSRAPSATRGAGSCWPIVVSVWPTAGSMTSSTGFG